MHLTPKAFDLLALLIARAPAVVPKAEIHEQLWPGTFVSDATLAGLVKEVRRALGDDRAGAIIRTAHRVGFAFAASIDATSGRRDPPPVTHWLIVGTRRIALLPGANVIGRDPDATVWLDVPGVSRRHAQVILLDGVAVLEDLGSKNGTLVGDRPVRGRVALRHADEFRSRPSFSSCTCPTEEYRPPHRRSCRRRRSQIATKFVVLDSERPAKHRPLRQANGGVEKRALRSAGRDPRWVPNPARQSRCAPVLPAAGCHARSRLPARTAFRRQGPSYSETHEAQAPSNAANRPPTADSGQQPAASSTQQLLRSSTATRPGRRAARVAENRRRRTPGA